MRWLRRLLAAAVLLLLALAAPVIWVEFACTGERLSRDRAPLLPPEHRRDVARTLMTYPEWHIVHAYDDYAAVIAAGDPHDFGYVQAIAGFWRALCPLKTAAMELGEIGGDSKATIYTIGVSFTVELLAKAAYEETLGRAATWIRGADRAPLDDLSAKQAARYAVFLQQTPWYRWDFRADAAKLARAATDAFRDGERRLALDAEYRLKALYAGVIEGAVDGIGADALVMRSVVTGLDAETLDRVEGVTVIGPLGDGIEIETPRYRAFTRIAERIAEAGGDFAEIAGNDVILYTAITGAPGSRALFAFARQGREDWRVLHLVDVANLADAIRAAGGAVEHIHDY